MRGTMSAEGVQAATPWLTAEEAAAHLRIGRRTLERYIAERGLPVHRIGDSRKPKRLFRADELDRWVGQQGGV